MEQGAEYRLIPDVEDVWCQDYMPLHTPNKQLIKFRHRLGHPQPNGKVAPEVPEDLVMTLPFVMGCRYLSIQMDGGCMVQQEDTVLVSQSVAQWNQRVTQEELTEKLKSELNAHHFIWLPTHPEDSLAHVQREVRLLSPTLALITEPHGGWEKHTRQIESLLKAEGFDVHRLPAPALNRTALPRHDYLSFLRVGNMLLVPVYGCHQDQVALDTLKFLAPNDRVQPVHIESLGVLGGFLDRLAWVQEVPDDLGDWYY